MGFFFLTKANKDITKHSKCHMTGSSSWFGVDRWWGASSYVGGGVTSQRAASSSPLLTLVILRINGAARPERTHSLALSHPWGGKEALAARPITAWPPSTPNNREAREKLEVFFSFSIFQFVFKAWKEETGTFFNIQGERQYTAPTFFF